MTLTALTSGNSPAITRLHSTKKPKPSMDDIDQRSESDNVVMDNTIAIEEPDALPQLKRFGEIDEPITPLDENSYVFDLEQSSFTSKSLGGSAVFVDGYHDEVNEQKPLDPSAFGDNIDDTSDVESVDAEKNDTPPTSTLTNEDQNLSVAEKTDLQTGIDNETAKTKNSTTQLVGSLMDKLRVSEVFNAAKAKGADDQNRPNFEFSRHISGDQLQNILKSVNAKELMESSDSESVKETLMHIQQAALDEVQEQEDQKGVVDEMLEALATSSGVSGLAGAISEQLRSQDVIEEAAERQPMDLESESSVLSEEELRPESLKEPEEPIFHVDLSACTSRQSSRFNSDYDEYWREYGLQFIVMLCIALLALTINILGR
ncbi:hypothetical protein K450DRAFT_261549 [Umbelopsis ramanniana AG]|uniref:Uncharacterized protein n=1 Tax=Umbelopsis ramanniana AG TaxID=1314678 RepID=A0AAD5H7Y0_UMBRA|nr:uncharacterized protein K450DRAFT_261549 [Umbelopsis ramanniana AG]KAI8575460.1 hypothetical protein K450DRAFT_261549 [Umbelopsis ramanniana AG]